MLEAAIGLGCTHVGFRRLIGRDPLICRLCRLDHVAIPGEAVVVDRGSMDCHRHALSCDLEIILISDVRAEPGGGAVVETLEPPNQALEPTSTGVTPRAYARVAPPTLVAHL